MDAKEFNQRLEAALASFEDKTHNDTLRAIILLSNKEGRSKKFIKNDWTIERYIEHVRKTFVVEKHKVERLRAVRDNEAWTHLLNKLLQQTRSKLSSWQLDYATADDVAEDHVQDIVEQIWRGKYYYDVPFDAWVSRVANNTLRKGAREAKSKKRQLETKALRLDEQEVSEMLAGSADSPELALIVRQHHDAIEQGLEQIPASQQTFIELHYFNALPLSEVAEQMNKDIKKIYELNRRTKKQLKQILGDLGIEYV